jgi:hypothetical protein
MFLIYFYILYIIMNTHLICNIEYDNELNNRIMSRIMPTQELPPNFSPRPEPTKYSHFKTCNTKHNYNNSIRQYKYFNTNNVFYTGNSKAPIHYFLDNVDLESRLRNQFFALQKNDQAFYIPDIHYSSLYNDQYYKSGFPKDNEVNALNYNITTINKCNLAPKPFNNSTRYNLKNLK